MIAALAVALRYYGDGGSRPPPKASVPAKQVQAERVVTLLDFWAQTLVPDILLQQSRAHALRVGDVANAVRLGTGSGGISCKPHAACGFGSNPVQLRRHESLSPLVSGQPDLRAAILARMPETVISIGQLYGAAARAEELRALLREHKDRAAGTPGCRLFYVGVSLRDPDHYIITQEWEDPASLADFVRSPAVHDFQRRLVGLLTREWRFRVYRVHDAIAVEDIAPMDPSRAD